MLCSMPDSCLTKNSIDNQSPIDQIFDFGLSFVSKEIFIYMNIKYMNIEIYINQNCKHYKLLSPKLRSGTQEFNYSNP